MSYRRLNFISAVRLDRELLPGMIEKKSGVIIHISTVAGRVPLWQVNMAYAASKAALNSYSKALANEVASKGVRVLTVSPGGTATGAMVGFLKQVASGFQRKYQRNLQESCGPVWWRAYRAYG